MADVYKGLTIQFGAETKGLDKALRGIDKSSRRIQTELRKVDRALKFNPGNTELLRQKQEGLAKQIGETKTRLDALKQAEKQLGKDDISTDAYNNLQREIIETESKLGHLEGKLAETSRAGKKSAQEVAAEWKKTGDRLKSIGDSVGGIGRKMTLGITAPIVAGGALVMREAVNYESAFAGVRKTVDATEAEFQELSSGIRDMAKQLPSSREEIAGVAEAAGQLGIETDNIIGFTRTMIDLGEATNLSSDQAATSLARLANITGMSQEKFSNLGSTIVALGNNFATTEAEITEMGLRLAGAGKQIGLSEAQILGISTALSSVGIEAEAGGSAISKTLINIASAVQSGGKELDLWAKTAGMSAAEFKRAFEQDAATAFDAVITGLGNMEAQGGSTLAQLEALGISEVRQRDALLRLSGSQGVLTDALALSGKAWAENTALTKEAEQRYGTLESKLGILKNQATDVGLKLGNALAPALSEAMEAAQPLIEAASDLAERFAEAEPEQQKMVLTLIGIAAVAGPVLVAIGSIVSAIGTIVGAIGGIIVPVTTFFSLLSAGSGVIGGLTAMFPLLGTAITVLTGPIGIVIAVVAALVAAIVYLWKNNETFREIVTAAWNAVKDAVLAVVEWFKTEPAAAFEKVKTAASNAFNGIVAFVKKWGPLFLAALGGPIGLAILALKNPKIMAAAVEIFTNVVSAVKEKMASVADSVRGALDKVKGFFSRLVLRLPKFKLPHFKLTGSLDLSKIPPRLPKLSVDWYASGGSFAAGSPQLVGVGDQRRGYEHILRDDQIVSLLSRALRAQPSSLQLAFTGDIHVGNTADYRSTVRQLGQDVTAELRARGVVGP